MEGGRRGGGGKQEGTVTLAGGFASHQHGPSPGEERGCHLSAGREQCEAASPHPGPAGTTQGLFCERMLSFPASQPHTSEPLPAPTAAAPARARSPRPREPRQGRQVQRWPPCPHGKIWQQRDSGNPENLKIPAPKWGMATTCSSPQSPFPLAGAGGHTRHDETLSCGPSKASGSLF